MKRTRANSFYLSKIHKVLNDAKKPQSEGKTVDVSKAYSLIDKATKRNVITKQKSQRLKSQVATAQAQK